MNDQNTTNDNWIESAWTDFLSFLGERKFDQCRAVMDSAGENGFEKDALKMLQKINKEEFTCESLLVNDILDSRAESKFINQ